MTILRRLIPLAFCALLLAACEIRSYLDIDMSDISDGTVSVQVGFDEQFREAMEEFGGGTDLVGELESDAPAEGWDVERFQDDDIEGVTLTKHFTSLEELQEIVEEGRVSGPQEGLVGEVTFTDTGDTIRFEADVPTSNDFEGFDPEQMEGLLTYDARISVTFPGEVIDHNGELVDRTVVWSFDDPTEMTGAELFAEARKGSGLRGVVLAVAIVGLGVLALGVVAVVLWLVLARRRPPVGVVPAGEVAPAAVVVPAAVATEEMATPGAAPSSGNEGPGWLVQPVAEAPEPSVQPNNESA